MARLPTPSSQEVGPDRVTGRGAIFVNPDAGKGNEAEDFKAAFRGHEVIETEPDDLAKAVRAALARTEPPAFIGVAGGDGSIRRAAEVVLEVSPRTPLLAIPAGTHNHFTR